ncbi:MAG TPA: serine/threonine-protein kinase, partial [Longimicrobiaceae bacterium]|nr:serine/threonine-protein kinase [Longimicrobiaceae bacterium]
ERCERCGAATAAAPAPLVLAGKFRLLERIGSGGMGIVYRGMDLALGREVAVKTLPRMSPREARWLRKEARAMAAVSHPNLALIFGAESWRGVPMLVVEYLPGGTLAERIARGPLPAEEAIALVGALVPALASLHDAAILHRDIKPNNIGFAADGTPKLLDFGLARALEAAHQAEGEPLPWRSPDAAPVAAWQGSFRETAAGEGGDWAGTLLYLAPEAVNGEPPAVSWDLWALCMVLYEALAGRHPLAGGAPHGTLLRLSEADVPPVRELAPEVPAPVAAFLRGALHADRRKRPASARELGERLQALRGALAAPVS